MTARTLKWYRFTLFKAASHRDGNALSQSSVMLSLRSAEKKQTRSKNAHPFFLVTLTDQPAKPMLHFVGHLVSRAMPEDVAGIF